MNYSVVATGGVSVSGHAWVVTDKASVRIDEALRWFLIQNLSGAFWGMPGRIQQGRSLQGTVSPRIVYFRDDGDELLYMKGRTGTQRNTFMLVVCSKKVHSVQNIVLELRNLLNSHYGTWKNHVVQNVEVTDWDDEYEDLGTFQDLGFHTGQVTVFIQSNEV